MFSNFYLQYREKCDNTNKLPWFQVILAALPIEFHVRKQSSANVGPVWGLKTLIYCLNQQKSFGLLEKTGTMPTA